VKEEGDVKNAGKNGGVGVNKRDNPHPSRLTEPEGSKGGVRVESILEGEKKGKSLGGERWGDHVLAKTNSQRYRGGGAESGEMCLRVVKRIKNIWKKNPSKQPSQETPLNPVAMAKCPV